MVEGPHKFSGDAGDVRQGTGHSWTAEWVQARTRIVGRKFEPTDSEKIRAEYDALPDRAGNEGELNRAEYDEVVKKMKKCKPTGIDGIPAEVWQNSKIANELLFRFLKKIWTKEEVSSELVVDIFVHIQKREP